jgi:hypothetical protein
MNEVSMIRLFIGGFASIAFVISAGFIVYLNLLSKKDTSTPFHSIRENKRTRNPLFQRRATDLQQ